MQAIILLLTLLLTSGCATQRGYNRMMQTWLDVNEADLIESWGPPDNFYQVDPHKRFLTYNRSASAFIPGTPQSNFVSPMGTVYSSGGSSPMLINRHCKTTFTIIDGIIKKYDWKGNSCRA